MGFLVNKNGYTFYSGDISSIRSVAYKTKKIYADTVGITLCKD